MSLHLTSMRPARITLQNFKDYSCSSRGGWTLDQLKKFCQDLNVSTTGNKAEVIQRIQMLLGTVSSSVEASSPPAPATVPDLYQIFLKGSYKADDIQTHRLQLHQWLGVVPNNVAGMVPNDLWRLYQGYDHLFFQNTLQSYFSQSKERMNFVFGNGKTTAGYCKLCKEKGLVSHTISISKPVHTSVFIDPSKTVETVDGLQAKDQLTCLQLTFEHEMIHLLIHIWGPKESEERVRSHGDEFKALALNIFGHTGYHHTIGQGLSETPEIHAERVKQILRPDNIVQVYNFQLKKNIPYQVIKVNRTRFLGLNLLDKKKYNVPIQNVVFEDDETQDDD